MGFLGLQVQDRGCRQKVVIRRFLNYMMVDSKIMITQVEEIDVEDMVLSETYQVAVTIEKLPSR